MALHLLLGALLFSPALLSGGAVLPGELLHAVYPWGAYFPFHANHNRELTDVVLQFHPWSVEWAHRILSGELPLWCAESGLGLPGLARAISAPFFPLSALSLLGPVTGWNLLLLGRLVLAGTTTFLWLRDLGRSREASVMGSVAFASSLPFFTWLPWPHANVQALLPLLLLGARRLALRGGPGPAALFGATLALMHLGGHPESVFLDAGAAVLVFVSSARSSLRRRLLPLVGAGVIGTLAASVQIVPFLEYLLRSRVLGSEHHAALALPPSRLVTWIVPSFFGREMDHDFWARGVGFLDFGAFAGTSILALALAGLLLGRRRPPLGLLIAGGLSVGLAYGLPVVRELSRLPLLDRTMTHRSLPIAAAAVVALAAFGWDRLLALGRLRRRRVPWATLLFPAAVAAAGGAAALAAWLLVPQARPQLAQTALRGALAAAAIAPLPWLCLAVSTARLRTLCATGVVLLDLWAASWGWHGTTPRGLVLIRTGVTDLLSVRREEGRTLPLGWAMPPNTNLPYGIRSVLSYDAIDLGDQAEFLRGLGGLSANGLYSTVFPDRLANVRVAELASIRFFLQDPLERRLDTPAFAARTGFALRVAYDAPDGRIYELRSARPTAWFTGTAEADPGLRRFGLVLASRDAAAVEHAYLDATEAPPTGGVSGEVTVVARGANQLELRCKAAGPGVVLVSEQWYPGWTAEVNGVSARVFRANGVLRAVAVPRGESRIVLRYEPKSFRVGAGLSLAGILALAACGVRAAKRRTGVAS